jgi:Zn-dependent protease with chaperone function
MKKGFAKILINLLITLFFIPGISLVFTQYASHSLSNEISQVIIASVKQSNQDVTHATAFLAAHPPESVCGIQSTDLQAQRYQYAVCRQGSELWQFHIMALLAIMVIASGVLALLLVVLLAGMAFLSPLTQSLSLRLSRPLLMLISFFEVLVQGGMLVWLSFWITAFFSQHYSPKLIMFAGLAVLAGVFYTIKGMFRKLPKPDDVEGVEIDRAQSPALWTRLNNLASRLGTAAPDHVIAGIDASFYVTEAPLNIQGKQLNGRKLYVSLPLLRHLTPEQADGVMVHELTHLHKGDSATKAALSPKLHHLDLYIHLMKENLATRVVYYLLYVYRTLFELAWQRDSRRREFIADSKAAEIAGPATIVESLIKISAYAGYWSEVANQMFAQDNLHTELSMRQAIAQGLSQYVQSEGFIDMMRKQNVPHPFDSHPSLRVRMQNVGYLVEEDNYAAIATEVPLQSWVNLIPQAESMEQGMWNNYEHEFSDAHEESLAWRCQPQGEEQIALVEKHFPPANYTLKGGKTLTISWQGITEPEQGSLLLWDDISKIQHNRRFGVPYISLNLTQNPKKPLHIYLHGIKKQEDEVTILLERYWARHNTMRKHQTELSAA